MAKKKALPAARKTNGGAPVAPTHYAQMQEAAQRFDRLLAAVQELPEDILAEASSQAELELALEDVGWLRFGIDQGGAVSSELRRRIIERSRAYWQFDPVARHVVRLWTVYSVGTGLSYKARDPKTQGWLDEFFRDTRNRRVLSPQGQQKSSRRCLIDGVLPLGLFRFEDDGLVVRRFDPLQITEILSDPEDEERVLFYKREYIDARGNQQTQYLKDWLEADEEDLPEVLDPLTKKPINALVKDDEETPLVYYINFEDFLQQGTPLLQPVLDWLRELRKFLESRVAFAQALMRYAWKLRAKGGQDKLTELRLKLQSSLAQGFAAGETNPPAAAGSTWMETMATELVGLPRETGAAGARNDADLFKLQVSSGTGIFLHYLGDPSCYAEDTEVLTERGFMLHQDWKPGTRVACFNPSTHLVEFHHPLELRSFDYEGPMVSFRNAQTDILVTPNHKMLCAPQVNWKLLPARLSNHRGRRRVADGGVPVIDRSWQMMEAERLFAKPREHGWRFVAAAAWDGTQRTGTDAFARFLGYWLAEGWTVSSRPGTVCLSQKPGAILEKMRATLREIGHQWSESENQSGCKILTFVNIRLWAWLREHCGIDSHSKRIPDDWLLATEEERRGLFETLMEGDGGASGASLRYSSVSKNLADDVQRLALSLGYGASVKLELREWDGRAFPIWRVWIRRRWMETRIRPRHVSIVHYEGKVHCFHLPHHVYITRRNGKIAVQGNTGNLATATAMELPMLKIFEAYQQLWTSVYSDLCEIAQVVRGAKKPQPVDIDWPPIVRADLVGIADATSKLLTAVPGLAQPEVMQVVLLALGINNVDDVVKRVLGPSPSLASTEALTRALKETKETFERVLAEQRL